jgi:hypothetical protein
VAEGTRCGEEKIESAPEKTHDRWVLLPDIEAPCSKLQGIFDPQGCTIYSNRSLTPQQATGNALAPGFNPKEKSNHESMSAGQGYRIAGH